MADNLFDDVPEISSGSGAGLFDDVPDTGMFDDVSEAVPQGAREPDTFGSAAKKQLIDNFGDRVQMVAGGLIQKASESPIETLQSGVSKFEDMSFLDKAKVVSAGLGILRQGGDINTPVDKARGAVNEFGKEMFDDAKAEAMANQPVGLGPVSQFGIDALTAMQDMVPAIIAGAATKNPAASLSVISGQVYGQTYGDGVQKGLDPIVNSNRAFFHTMAEAIPEAIPVAAILKKGSPIVKRYFDASVGEAVQEALTSILQDTYDATTLENMTLKEAISNLDWSKVARDGMLGFAVGSGLMIGKHGSEKVFGSKEPAAPEENADPLDSSVLFDDVPEVNGAPVQQDQGGIDFVPNEADRGLPVMGVAPRVNPKATEETTLSPDPYDLSNATISLGVHAADFNQQPVVEQGIVGPQLGAYEGAVPFVENEADQNLPIQKANERPPIAKPNEVLTPQTDSLELETEAGYGRRRMAENQPVNFFDPRLSRQEHRQSLEKIASTLPDDINNNELNESTDDILTAIAKLGGISRAEAAAQGIDPEHFKGKATVFGKPVFRETGGQSFDGMTEALSQTGYLPFGDITDFAQKLNNALQGESVYSDSYDYDNKQDFAKDLGEGAKPSGIKTAIGKALSGERIGTREQRIISNMLDNITSERSSGGRLDSAKTKLADARSTPINTRKPLPLGVYQDSLDNNDGAPTEDYIYDASIDEASRNLLDLMNEVAESIGDRQAVRQAILDHNTYDEWYAAVQNLAGDKANGQQKEQAPVSTEATEKPKPGIRSESETANFGVVRQADREASEEKTSEVSQPGVDAANKKIADTEKTKANLSKNKKPLSDEADADYPATDDPRILKARENQKGKDIPKEKNYKNNSDYMKDFNENRAESWMAKSAGIIEVTPYERYQLHEATDAQQLAMESKIGKPLKKDGKFFIAWGWSVAGINEVPVRRVYPIDEYKGETHTDKQGGEGRIIKHGKTPYVVGEQWVLIDEKGTSEKNLPVVEKKLTLSFEGKEYPVESFEDASNKFRRVIEETGAGSSDLSEDPEILENGNVIAYVSFNGRVWAEGVWKKGKKPLYDPRQKIKGVPAAAYKDVSPSEVKRIIGESNKTKANLAKNKKSIDDAAHEAATSPKNDLPEPTEAQQEAGNYKKGRVTIHGLNIAIENPKGSVRKGVDDSGKEWSVKMKNHYGYFERTEGKDGDEVDVFLTADAENASTIFIVDQIDPKTNKFDEHKVVIGPYDQDSAYAAYLANYNKGWQGAGAISEMDIGEFKTWLEGDTTKPVLYKEPKNKEASDLSAYEKGKNAVKGFRDALTNKESPEYFIRDYLFNNGANPSSKTLVDKFNLHPEQAENMLEWNGLNFIKGKPSETGMLSYINDLSKNKTKANLAKIKKPAKVKSGETGDLFAQPATIDNKENDDDAITRPRKASNGTLERVSAETVSKPERSGDTRSDANESGRADAQGNGRADRSGNDGTRSLGDNTGTVSVPTSRVENYTITDKDNLGEGGAKTKYKNNVAAIRLLKQLDSEQRQATPDEQSLLVKYVGWGGIPQAFDSKQEKWSKEYSELKAILTLSEYEEARRSTQDAHYTSKSIIKGIFKAIQEMGFNGGKVLEPSLGTGNFIGLMPAGIKNNSRFTGVELDPITSGIAKHLYPKANIHNKGYQDTNFPNDYFDISVGNPPFGSQKIFDKTHKDLRNFSIHNYFFAKTIDKVRPGGVVGMVVSNFLLDAKTSKAREYMAERAELLGAIRLPNNAFKENAGTEVTTDIIFLKKLKEGQTGNGDKWTGVGTIQDAETGNDINLNQYFIDNPSMMLGEMTLQGSMYAGDSSALVAKEGQDTDALLQKAIESLPKNIYKADTRVEEALTKVPVEVSEPSKIKVNGYGLDDNGQLVERTPDYVDEPQFTLLEVEGKPAERMKGMIELRTVLRDLMKMELSTEYSDGQIKSRREALNRAYDNFVKKNGYIHAEGNKRIFRADPDFPLLLSLEVDFDKGVTTAFAKKHGVDSRKASAKKADIFTKRVLVPYSRADHADNAQDALSIALSESGRVDLLRMSELTGIEPEQLADDLSGVIFKDPTKGWITSDEYLSGDVKTKLAEAITARKETNDSVFNDNIKALEAVQPEDIEAVDIEARLGSHWIPESDINQFVSELIGASGNIKYIAALGKWSGGIGLTSSSVENTSTWGTERVPASKSIPLILNGKAIKVFDRIDEETTVLNKAETLAANNKADAVRREFQDWLWRDNDRRARLHRYYNDTFNNIRLREYDGSHLTFPGMTPLIELRPHQKNLVWRLVQEGLGLLDHTVGAGKTFAMIAASMERRRMGLHSKPMFTVPNHLVGQWSADFLKLYPNAKVLAATKDDFKKENRVKFFSKVATGDWDAVIIAHSSLIKVPMPKEEQAQFLRDQLDEIQSAIDAARSESGKKDRSIKEIEKSKDSIKTKLKELLESQDKDDTVDFSELGVDAIYLDEAHEYKNLFFATSMTRVAGLGSPKGSQKAFDLFVKTQYMQNKHNNTGVVFATGTPISNTIAEMFTVQRYLQYSDLKSKGIHHFDAWANMFGSIVSAFELDATGVNYKMNSRFAKFTNVPELMNMYQSIADVITLKDLEAMANKEGKVWPIPKHEGGAPENVIVERSADQSSYMDEIIERAENPPKDPREDNMLKITNDARKMALDMRLIDGSLDDHEESKISVAANNIIEINDKWDSDKGTQLVFIDLSTPKGNKKEDATRIKDLIAKAKDGDEDAIAALEKVSMDDLLAAQSDFSVYQALADKLTEHGMDSNKIAFIHDAKTDLQKEALFDKVRRGEIRVLFGSTAKMGAGMNVQNRLVAIHHLDAPWRPSDVEQRNGRILRQGNELYARDPEGFRIRELRYATKQTYDARMWQVLEAKARFIEQLRQGNTSSRTVEDIGGAAASFADLKAAATGNPIILEQVKLTAELQRLDSLATSHNRGKHRLQDIITNLEGFEERADKEVKRIKDMIELRDNNIFKKDEFKIEVKDKTFTKKDKGGGALAQELTKMTGEMPGVKKKIGSYRGFKISLARNSSSVVLNIDHDGYVFSSFYEKADKISGGGAITRLNNLLEKLDDRLELREAKRQEDADKLKAAIKQVDSPFEEQAKLDLTRKQHDYVMAELERLKDKDYDPMSVEDVLAGVQPPPKPESETDGDVKFSKIKSSDHSKDASKKPKGVKLEHVEKIAEQYKQKFKAVKGVKFILVETPDKVFGKKSKELGIIKGGFDTNTDTLYIFSDNMENAADVHATIRHEIVTHYGLRQLLSKKELNTLLDLVLRSRKANVKIKALFSEIERDYPLEELEAMYPGKGLRIQAEEVIARAAERHERSSFWRDLWGKILSALRKVGLVNGPISMTEIENLIAVSTANLQTGKRNYQHEHSDHDAFESRRRESDELQEKVVKNIKKGQPIDAVLKPIFKAAGIDKATIAAYDKAEHLITTAKFKDDSRFEFLNLPIETARAGLIDRYGLSEEYKELDLKREADERRLATKGINLVQSLIDKGIDRKEAQVLQAVLEGEQVADSQWTDVAAPIRQAIDELGHEAVELGLLDRASFEKNRGTYLHRVYKKHELHEDTISGFVSKVLTSRRKKIYGNTLKGRGMNMKVDEASLRIFDKEWFGIKRQHGRLSDELIDREYIVLDRMSHVGEGTETIPGLEEGGRRPRTLERIYWPKSQALPAKYGSWENRGTWAVRGQRGDKITLWRDFSKQERTNMGQILDARYTIARTFQLLSKDIATGRFLKEVSENSEWATDERPEGVIADGSVTFGRKTYAQYDWVQVPDTSIPETGGKKRWGALAGKYIKAEIWRDLNELNEINSPKVWRKILTQWKLNKTARNPVVHLNNVMSNLIFMDLADVRFYDLYSAVQSLRNKDQHYLDAVEHGAFGSSFVEQEIKKNILDPLLKELDRQNNSDKGYFESKLGASAAFVDTLSKFLVKADRKMIDYYQLEDSIFRMATYHRRLDDGDAPQHAALFARDQFLNYDIRAPWVNALRQTALPFISYTYRAVPVMARSVAERPWKIAKYLMLAKMAGVLAYALTGGDEDDERKGLPDDLQGNTLIGVPKAMRVWNDGVGDPVFLDVRRWIPAGDVFDTNMGQIGVPAPFQVGGPLMIAFELGLNKAAFTGRQIWDTDTDSGLDIASKSADFIWKSLAPSAPWIPGSYAYEKIGKSFGGKDPSGNDYELKYTVPSALGVKLRQNNTKLGKRYHKQQLDNIMRKQDKVLSKAIRDEKRGLISKQDLLKVKANTRARAKEMKQKVAELR